MKYNILKPMITNGEIIGYRVLDNSTNTIKKIKIEDMFRLVEKGVTDGILVKDSSNHKHIYVGNKVSCSDDNTTYTIEGRIVEDSKLIGYKCRSSLDEYIRISPLKLWELAGQGRVHKVKAKIINNKPAILGDGIEIESLPVIAY